MLSNQPSGSLSEMVLVDGFKFGIETDWALLQLTTSLESRVSQKALSSASVLNLGTLLAFFINFPLFTVHITSGNDTN